MMAQSIPMAKRSLPLSTRVTVFFGVLAMLGALALSVTTFLVTRTSLLGLREDSAEQAAIRNARQTYQAFGDPQTIGEVLSDIDFEPGGYAIAIPPGFASSPESDRAINSRIGISLNDFPPDLIDAVRRGESAHRQFEDRDGNPQLGYAIAIEAYDGAYLEAFPLTSIDRTLRVLSGALIVA